MNLCGFEVGLDQPLFLIAGPDSLESKALAVEVAGKVAEICAELGIGYIFKGSFDKANRSSGDSYRGPGMETGLDTLAAVKREVGVPVTTDVHVEAQIAPVAAVVDLLQTPAFLCRQTDFIHAVAASGIPVNILLFPMEGDYDAAIAYWTLAYGSGGSFMAVSRDWP